MADLGGSTIASTYQAILALPLTGGDATNLVALTDGDGVNTFALSVATTSIAISPTDKFYFDDGGNTYIHEGGADRLDFVVGGDTNGFVLLEENDVTKVGIGLLAPSVNLHIYRDTSDETSLLRLEEDGVGDAKMAYTLSGSSAWQTGIDNTDNAFKIASQETGAWTDTRLTILTDGKVGIGTDTPYSPLHIKSAAEDDLDGIADGGTAIPQVLIEGSGDTAGDNSPILCLHNSSTGTDNDFIGRIAFTAGDDGDSTPADPSQGTEYASIVARISDVTDSTTDGLLYFYTDVNNTAIQTLALKGGKVGIGVADPDAPLEVTNTAESGADQNVAHFSTAVGANLYLRNSDLSDDEGTWSFVGGANEDICIIPTGTGNVGIGTDSPGWPLHVSASKSTDAVCKMNNSNGTSPRVLHLDTSGAAPNDATAYFIYAEDSGGQKFTARSNGGLANYSANDANLASDERLKKDIAPLVSHWNKLKQLEVVTFKYKDQTDDTDLYGMIAQKVKETFPEFSIITREATETDPEYYGLREKPIWWITTKVLQEAMARIESLETKVTALEDEDSSSDTKIAALEAKDTASEAKIAALEAKDTEYATTIAALTARITALESA